MNTNNFVNRRTRANFDVDSSALREVRSWRDSFQKQTTLVNSNLNCIAELFLLGNVIGNLSRSRVKNNELSSLFETTSKPKQLESLKYNNFSCYEALKQHVFRSMSFQKSCHDKSSLKTYKFWKRIVSGSDALLKSNFSIKSFESAFVCLPEMSIFHCLPTSRVT